MNLHLAHDDKFLDIFIRNQSKIEEFANNKYLLSSSMITLTKSKGVHNAGFNTKKYFEIIGDWSQYDKVYIHYFDPKYFEIVRTIPSGIKVIWIFWGGDAFYLPAFSDKYLLPITKDYVYSSNPLREFFFPGCKPIFQKPSTPRSLMRNSLKYLNERLTAWSQQSLWRSHVKAFSRVDYFAHYLPEDFNSIVTSYPTLKASLIDFNYGSVQDFLTPNKSNSGKNLLLGNSGAETNNHLDALRVIPAQFEGKIICPLSYGAANHYVGNIMRFGGVKFKNSFLPLLEFLPLKDYQRLLSSCGLAIMNHIRSQAAGNIFALLSKGTKVAMNPDSNLFKFLLDKGLIVSAFDADLFSFSGKFEPLSLQQIESNKVKLNNAFCNDAVLRRYENLFQLNT